MISSPLVRALSIAIAVFAAAAPSVPTAARSRGDVEAARAAKAMEDAKLRQQTLARAKAEAQLRVHRQFLIKYRMNILAKANAAVARARAVREVADAARAQRDLADAAHAAHDAGKALVNYRKWAGNKLMWHHFQGVIPPEELRRFEKDRAKDDAERARRLPEGCATAGQDGAPKPANCETPGS